MHGSCCGAGAIPFGRWVVTVRVTPSDPQARPLWRAVPTMQAVTLHAAALAPDRTVWAVGERGVVLPFLPSGT